MNPIDISTPLTTHTATWPSDPQFRFDPAARIEDGEICNVSTIAMSTHFGTHVDAPWHFENHGKRLHEIGPEIFFGPATIIHVPEKIHIDATDLGPSPLPARILLKTDNSNIPHDAPFDENYTALTPEAAQRIVDEHVKLIGIDYLSIAPFHDPAPVHHILLRAEVLIVEFLRLKHVNPGHYDCTILPLPLQDADGAPARAFIRQT